MACLRRAAPLRYATNLEWEHGAAARIRGVSLAACPSGEARCCDLLVVPRRYGMPSHVEWGHGVATRLNGVVPLRMPSHPIQEVRGGSAALHKDGEPASVRDRKSVV